MPELKRGADGGTGNKMTMSTGTIIHIYAAVKAVKAPNIVAPPLDTFFHCVSLLFLSPRPWLESSKLVSE